MNPLHVVSVSSEMVPFAKTGGLGDVCGALPPALSALGCKCTAFLPAYRSVLQSGIPIEPTDVAFTVHIGDRNVACRILKTRLPNSDVDVFLVDQPQYFDRDGFYSDQQGDFRDNCERFCFFNRAVVQAIDHMKLAVDIVHCHDWQAGLIPAYVKLKFNNYAWMERAKSLMTIHNLAFQGKFWHLDMPLTGLDWMHFNWEEMEFHGELNLMKTGIVFADRVTTVSPTYAREITMAEHGCGLESILGDRGERLSGIVNGVDYAQWNPQTDHHLPMQFGIENWAEGKAACKQELQKELGLELQPKTPLIGIVSRLADQKGWDLIIPLLLHWSQNHNVQWAILGTGDQRYEQELAALAKHHPHRLSVSLAFSEALAHRIEAAGDIFMMPSRYEPCGLNQLYSLKYGSVPLVTSTGGLADTVIDTTEATLADGTATGFVCHQYDVHHLEATLHRAIEFYLHRTDKWSQIVTTGMKTDWSWETSAQRYMEVYEQTLGDNSRG